MEIYGDSCLLIEKNRGHLTPWVSGSAAGNCALSLRATGNAWGGRTTHPIPSLPVKIAFCLVFCTQFFSLFPTFRSFRIVHILVFLKKKRHKILLSNLYIYIYIYSSGPEAGNRDAGSVWFPMFGGSIQHRPWDFPALGSDYTASMVF